MQVLAHDALAAAARHLRGRGAEGTCTAGTLEERGRRIRASVLEQFWVEDGGVGFFAAALDFSVTGTRRPLRTRVGDMGHLLTSRLLRGAGGDVRERRDAVIRQLFSRGLLCSVGIRSLHADEVRYWPGGYHTGNSWLWQSMHIADGLEQHGFAHLAEELRGRCRHIHLRTGLLPEFARGDGDHGVLNDRIVDLWQAADQRENRLEQPPQEVQAWPVASLYAAKRRIGARAGELPPPTPLERNVLAELPDRSEGRAFWRGRPLLVEARPFLSSVAPPLKNSWRDRASLLIHDAVGLKLEEPVGTGIRGQHEALAAWLGECQKRSVLPLPAAGTLGCPRRARPAGAAVSPALLGRRGGLGERHPRRSRRRAVRVVLDANVVVALVADKRQPAARAHLEEWLDAGEELHAPAVLPYEIANVLARLVFEGALQVNDVTEIWHDLAAFDLQLHPFDLAHDGQDVAAITAQLRRRFR